MPCLARKDPLNGEHDAKETVMKTHNSLERKPAATKGIAKRISTGDSADANETLAPLKAFRRTKSLETSTWYMSNLTTYLVEEEDSNGDFSLIEAVMGPGNEPPPLVHSREDELYYILEGEFDVYVGEEAFKVQIGECVFLPKLKPHAFVIRSSRIRLLLITTPGGLEKAFRSMASPAQSLDLPAGMSTYSTTDSKQTAQRFAEYGVRFLEPDEIEELLPLYPNPLPREAPSARQR
jgi:mannose-6-phosphate isomerase-like protein (cupin superfamily)